MIQIPALLGSMFANAASTWATVSAKATSAFAKIQGTAANSATAVAYTNFGRQEIRDRIESIVSPDTPSVD